MRPSNSPRWRRAPASFASCTANTPGPWACSGEGMNTKTRWESFKAESENAVDKLTGFDHEGNVRRVVVKHGDRTVAEFPLTVGVVGAVLAPVLAAVGALVALMKDCTIEIERIRDS